MNDREIVENEIYKFGDCSYEVGFFMDKLKELTEQNKDKYDEIKIELREDIWEQFDVCIIGYRKENDEEYNERKDFEKRRQEKFLRTGKLLPSYCDWEKD